ncbi:hypothetical protein FRB99_002002 [Tulasnella sp. 403]|nr:hypothetical protein FRB99_002002 [Tulasnella sp. 403]
MSPTWESIESALPALWDGIDSIKTSDGGDIPYFGSSTIPLSAFRKVLDEQIALQQRARNDLLPIHRLPRLIFVHILQLAYNFFAYYGWILDLEELHRYAQVSTYWRDVILSTPWFWRVVRDGDPKAIRELCLRRSGSAGVVLWSSRRQGRRRHEYLQRMVPVAMRWEMVYIEGNYSQTVFDILSHIPPRLKDLTVRLTSDTTTRLLPLPDGAALWHLTLDHVAVPWNSMRLRALRSLQLCGVTSYFPSLQQLFTVLSSSRQLSSIILEKWSADEPLPDFEDDSARLVDAPIVLPALDMLVITRIQPQLASFLLKHISGPNLQSVVALDLRPDAFSDPISLLDTLRPALHSVNQVILEYTSDPEHEVLIKSDPEAAYTALYAYTTMESSGLRLICSMKDATVCDWKNVFEFLAQADVEVMLEMFDDPSLDVEPATIAPTLSLLPLDSLSCLRPLVSAGLNCRSSAGGVLRYLGASRPCPSLKEIHFFSSYAEIEVMVEDVVAFVKGRYTRDEESAEESGRLSLMPLGSLSVPHEVVAILRERPEMAPVLDVLQSSTDAPDWDIANDWVPQNDWIDWAPEPAGDNWGWE